MGGRPRKASARAGGPGVPAPAAPVNAEKAAGVLGYGEEEWEHERLGEQEEEKEEVDHTQEAKAKAELAAKAAAEAASEAAAAVKAASMAAKAKANAPLLRGCQMIQRIAPSTASSAASLSHSLAKYFIDLSL